MCSAIVFVDCQRDFMEKSGKLYVPGAEKIIENLLNLATHIRATRHWTVDHHANDDPEFATYPPHCIIGTEGAEIIPEVHPCMSREFIINNTDIISKNDDVVFRKNTVSVFDNGDVGEYVNFYDNIFVCGVVTEICVKAMLDGLLDMGHKPFLIVDACRSLWDEESQELRDFIGAYALAGVKIIDTESALFIAEDTK